jgi:hypothetical protein
MDKIIQEPKAVTIIKPRRLQFQGGSVYCALPRDWALFHDLDKHRSVQITIDSESRLIIEPLK